MGQIIPLLLILPIWSVVKDLSSSSEPLNISGDIKDADTALKFAIKEGIKFIVGNFYVDRTMLCYLSGKYPQALQMAKKALEQRRICDYTLSFYEGLAALAIARTSQPYLRRKYLCRGRKLMKHMKVWARRCPKNFRNKQLLMEAEIAALNGKSSKAFCLFEQSIQFAVQEGLVHEAAISYERWGHYQLYLGDIPAATLSFENARTLFEKWGATRLVDRIDNIIASI
jgi:tetratricopeptide (TPR) repeat protein